MSEVKRLGEKYLQHMINLRETIHMYPEDGFSEFFSNFSYKMRLSISLVFPMYTAIAIKTES